MPDSPKSPRLADDQRPHGARGAGHDPAAGRQERGHRHPDAVLPPQPDCQRRLPAVRGGGGRRAHPAAGVRGAGQPRTWWSTPRPTACNTARRVILELLASTVDLSEAPEVLDYIERYGARAERFAGGVRREIALKDDNPFYIRDYSQVRHVLALHPGLRRGCAEHLRADLGRPRHRQPRDHRVRGSRCPTRRASSAGTASASARRAR